MEVRELGVNEQHNEMSYTCKLSVLEGVRKCILWRLFKIASNNIKDWEVLYIKYKCIQVRLIKYSWFNVFK